MRAALSLGALFVLACTSEPLPTPRDPAGPVLTATAPPTFSASAPPTPTFEPLLSSLDDELFPRLSPTGTLVFTRESLASATSNAAIFALEVGAASADGAARRLTREGKYGSIPALSRDGATLVYLSNALGPLALLKTTVAADGPTSVVVSSDKAREPSDPTLSPDGNTVAFSFVAADGVRTIATVGLDGSKLTPLFPGRAPAFAPDGRTLVFVAPASGHNHLFVATLPSTDAAPSAPRALTQGNFDCDHPSFSPDGRRIVFSSNREFAEHGAPRETFLRIFVMNADGSSPRALTPADVRAATPSWGFDGRVYFAFSRGESFDLARLQP
jgi:Tol biopolymer transport system component